MKPLHGNHTNEFHYSQCYMVHIPRAYTIYMTEKNIFQFTDRLLSKKKKSWIASVEGFRPGIEPGFFERQSNTLTFMWTKYPHDLASSRTDQISLFIVIVPVVKAQALLHV